MRKMSVLVLVLLCCLSVNLFAGANTEQTAVPVAQAAPKMAAEQVYREGFIAAAQGQSTFVTTTGHRLDATVNEPMVALDWKGGLMPLLAERFEMLENGKVWIMHIRQNAKWHDGADVTAADVVFSYSAYANPRVASRWNSKAASIQGYAEVRAGSSNVLSGVTAIDAKTVRIELSKAMPLWMKLEQSFLVIFPDHILGKVAPEELVAHPYWRARVGTGPFVWKEYKPDQYIMLERNTNYYLGAPKLEKIYYVIFNDAASQLNALASGQIHSTAYEMNLITPQEANMYDAMANTTVVAMDKGSPSSLLLNLKRADWADARVRQALRYAIDVESIIASIYPGAREAVTMFPQPWTHADGMNQYDYNPEKAKQLLTEAGWTARDVDLVYTQSDALTQNLLVAVQQYLKAIGINLKLRRIDAAAMTAHYSNPDFDMAFVGNGMGLDPVSGENLIKKDELLAMFYVNNRVNELLELGKAKANEQERKPIYQEISNILNNELPKIFLWYDVRHLGFNDKVIGPKEHFAEQGIIYFNQPVYNEVQNWYIVE